MGNELPWQRPELLGWSICGMNHYYVNKARRLYVSMAKDGRHIKVEGMDHPDLWDQLVSKAVKAATEAAAETFNAPCDFTGVR